MSIFFSFPLRLFAFLPRHFSFRKQGRVDVPLLLRPFLPLLFLESTLGSSLAFRDGFFLILVLVLRSVSCFLHLVLRSALLFLDSATQYTHSPKVKVHASD